MSGTIFPGEVAFRTEGSRGVTREANPYLDSYYEATDRELLQSVAQRSSIPLDVSPTYHGNPTEYGLWLFTDHGSYNIIYVSKSIASSGQYPYTKQGWAVTIPGPMSKNTSPFGPEYTIGQSIAVGEGIRFINGAISVLEDYFRSEGITPTRKARRKQAGGYDYLDPYIQQRFDETAPDGDGRAYWESLSYSEQVNAEDQFEYDQELYSSKQAAWRPSGGGTVTNMKSNGSFAEVYPPNSEQNSGSGFEWSVFDSGGSEIDHGMEASMAAAKKAAGAILRSASNRKTAIYAEADEMVAIWDYVEWCKDNGKDPKDKANLEAFVDAGMMAYLNEEYSYDDIERYIDGELEIDLDRYPFLAKALRKATKKENAMPNRRRQAEFGRNDQGEWEDTQISQTPPAEPAVDPSEGGDAPNSTNEQRVQRENPDNNQLAAIEKMERKLRAMKRQLTAGDDRVSTPEGLGYIIAGDESDYLIELDNGDRVSYSGADISKSSRRRTARPIGEMRSNEGGGNVRREDLYENYEDPSPKDAAYKAKRNNDFVAWVSKEHGKKLTEAKSLGELRSWARSYSRLAKIDVSELHEVVSKVAADKREAANARQSELEKPAPRQSRRKHQPRRRRVAKRPAQAATRKQAYNYSEMDPEELQEHYSDLQNSWMDGETSDSEYDQIGGAIEQVARDRGIDLVAKRKNAYGPADYSEEELFEEWLIEQGWRPEDLSPENREEFYQEFLDRGGVPDWTAYANRRKRAETAPSDDLNVAAPDDRINVEKPTQNVTDDEAQKSQFDKGDFGNNAGDDIAKPDRSLDHQWLPGEGRKSSRQTPKGHETVRLAEAYVAAGLADPSERWKLATDFEGMDRSVILDRTALLERVATVTAATQKKTAGNFGASMRSAVPMNLAGGGGAAVTAAADAGDSDTDFFLMK